jgi:hypothetical protein
MMKHKKGVNADSIIRRLEYFDADYMRRLNRTTDPTEQARHRAVISFIRLLLMEVAE